MTHPPCLNAPLMRSGPLSRLDSPPIIRLFQIYPQTPACCKVKTFSFQSATFSRLSNMSHRLAEEVEEFFKWY